MQVLCFSRFYSPPQYGPGAIEISPLSSLILDSGVVDETGGCSGGGLLQRVFSDVGDPTLYLIGTVRGLNLNLNGQAKVDYRRMDASYWSYVSSWNNRVLMCKHKLTFAPLRAGICFLAIAACGGDKVDGGSKFGSSSSGTSSAETGLPIKGTLRDPAAIDGECHDVLRGEDGGILTHSQECTRHPMDPAYGCIHLGEVGETAVPGCGNGCAVCARTLSPDEILSCPPGSFVTETLDAVPALNCAPTSSGTDERVTVDAGN